MELVYKEKLHDYKKFSDDEREEKEKKAREKLKKESRKHKDHSRKLPKKSNFNLHVLRQLERQNRSIRFNEYLSKLRSIKDPVSGVPKDDEVNDDKIERLIDQRDPHSLQGYLTGNRHFSIDYDTGNKVKMQDKYYSTYYSKEAFEVFFEAAQFEMAMQRAKEKAEMQILRPFVDQNPENQENQLTSGFGSQAPIRGMKEQDEEDYEAESGPSPEEKRFVNQLLQEYQQHRTVVDINFSTQFKGFCFETNPFLDLDKAVEELRVPRSASEGMEGSEDVYFNLCADRAQEILRGLNHPHERLGLDEGDVEDRSNTKNSDQDPGNQKKAEKEAFEHSEALLVSRRPTRPQRLHSLDHNNQLSAQSQPLLEGYQSLLEVRSSGQKP